MHTLRLNDLALLSSVTLQNAAQPELSAWLARVATAGGVVSGTVQGYVSTFIIALKNAGINSKLMRCGIYCGDFPSLKAPLFNTWGGAQDVLTNFVAGDYSESTGLANAAMRNGFLSTGANPTAIGVDANDWHMSAYVRTGSNGTTAVMGGQASGAGTASCYLLVSYGGTSYFESWSSANQISVADSLGVGLYLGTRRAANDIALYKNGSSIVTSATTGGTIANNSIAVHTYLDGGSNSAPTDRPISFYSLGTKLTGAEILALYNAVQALQTSLGRQV